MSVTDGEAAPKTERIQDFIFSRELAEVYLLLDFVLGRSDKSLATAFDSIAESEKNKDGVKKTGQDFIEEICQIPWPPTDGQPQPAKAAARTMLAKDRLNYVARPANGASIAFTLMVAGDENNSRQRSFWQRMSGLLSWRSNADGGEEANLKQWKRDVPSRMSLARHSYPGLVGSSWWFRWYNKAILVVLVCWLALTCALSWEVAAGRSILVRLDALKSSQAEINKRIEAEEAKSPTPPSSPPPGAAQDAAAAEPSIRRFCDRVRTEERDGRTVYLYETVAQSQLCTERRRNFRALTIVRGNLDDWLHDWRWLQRDLEAPPGTTPGRAMVASTQDVPLNVPQESFAAILLDVLAGAVLPIFYGILGAGAAAVRGVWAKMRDSLLSPRDLFLSAGQVALGAVVGSCIGLFVTTGPSADNVAQGAVLLANPTGLSPAALSFIAGFGVESVFIALEGFIKRIFNIKERDFRHRRGQQHRSGR